MIIDKASMDNGGERQRSRMCESGEMISDAHGYIKLYKLPSFAHHSAMRRWVTSLGLHYRLLEYLFREKERKREMWT